MRKKDIPVVDLFCGIGGLSYGFVEEGFHVVAGYDNDEKCQYAFEKNNNATFYLEDITKLKGHNLDKRYFDKDFKILVGCAPCQPFSSYSFKVKEKDEVKVNMLYSFSRLIKETNPTIISMENVPQLAKEDNIIFNDFCKNLKELGYFFSYQTVYCPDYGIPQTRKRLVLLASKLGEIELIDKTHKTYKTVRDTIGLLPPVAAGETHPEDILHRARELNEINLRRIQNTKEGGGWKDWPSDLLLACYKKKTGKSYGSVYGRMRWDKPSPTMTTHCTGLGNGRFGHPEQDRAITLREAALLQTFPISYDFFKSKNSYNPSVICKQIGNAVPPALGRVIAKSIEKHLIHHNIIQDGEV